MQYDEAKGREIQNKITRFSLSYNLSMMEKWTMVASELQTPCKIQQQSFINNLQQKLCSDNYKYLLLNSIIFPLILKFSDFFSPLKSKRFQIP
jgi:hypothetical protein